MSEEDKHLLIYSLLAYTIAGLLFGVGLMLKTNVALIMFYILAVALFLSSMLALFARYKKRHNGLFLFLDLIGIGLLALITVALISTISA